MKNLKILSLLVIATLTFSSCSNDDDNTPEIINEEEVITTITVTLVPQTGETVTLTSRDLDGDGPDEPVINVSGSLQAGMSYNGSVILQNETVSPAEVINEEIEEEADEHQFFYQVGSGLNATVSYADTENDYLTNGSTNPVGIDFTLLAGTASTGQLTVTLRHEPNKDAEGVSEGNLSNAGGETDIAQTFNLTIE
ncbi:MULTISPECIES: type 1 periplasmic binding fold superfamily protein [unclassified Leeuwenhoekiella]|uniref:type 1 periplasmic binding fold superfamily protein n=1 Tax=unclassified Leeuwenhoekiella TaxID=2615029 RepID=UPI000C54BFA3|nr:MULTISPECIES: type 1 periplasmic binding fold superfamily protein [unclassified Leeuwenhoekiella]MAW95027.1 type 1 periplasmic binding fold superfamily protein [Leeuwenhoekiella sp.]MBA79747.1 type 1 periplasmic binding fold superfamily protein [Leeuwenhoekiella sp.]|tara:strand:+ start:38099 stop:38686 length:588 start_codon:yes stop_codon:yes gene_type:complete